MACHSIFIGQSVSQSPWHIPSIITHTVALCFVINLCGVMKRKQPFMPISPVLLTACGCYVSRETYHYCPPFLPFSIVFPHNCRSMQIHHTLGMTSSLLNLQIIRRQCDLFALIATYSNVTTRSSRVVVGELERPKCAGLCCHII